MKPLQINRNQSNINLADLQLKTLIYTDKPDFITVLGKSAVVEGSLTDPKPTRRLYFTGMTDEVSVGAERRVNTTGLYNCRDLGGYLTQKGEQVKWGYLFRSDAPDHLEADDLAYLKAMQFDTVVDFRSPKEVKKLPDIAFGEKQHLNFDPHAVVARAASETPDRRAAGDVEKVRLLEDMAKTASGRAELVARQAQMIEQMRSLVLSKPAIKTYTQFLDCLIAVKTPQRVMFHCQGGKDRTGWAAALILGLLGVDKSVIYEDYLQTSHYNAPRNEKRMATYRALTDNHYVLDYLHSLQLAKPEYLDGAFQAVAEHYGSLENYAATALQFETDLVERLKELYLYHADDEAKLTELLSF